MQRLPSCPVILLVAPVMAVEGCSPGVTVEARSAACLVCCAGWTLLDAVLPDTVRGREPKDPGGVVVPSFSSFKLVSLNTLLYSMGFLQTQFSCKGRLTVLAEIFSKQGSLQSRCLVFGKTTSQVLVSKRSSRRYV